MLLLTPSQLDDYDLSDIWHSYLGYWRNQRIKERSDWERARWIAFYTVAPHSKKITKVKDIIEFDWEIDKSIKGTKANPWTKEELDKLRETHPFYKKKNGKKRD